MAKEKPTIIVEKKPNGLVPATAFDAEELDRMPLGKTFEVKPVDSRGHEQLAFYWAVLSQVVDATGTWPTREKLHEAIKLELGYVSVGFDMRGKPRLTVDSIALASMSDDDRRTFIDQALAAIAEATGIDPVALLPEAA